MANEQHDLEQKHSPKNWTLESENNTLQGDCKPASDDDVKRSRKASESSMSFKVCH